MLGLTPIETLDRVVDEAEVPELRKPALHMAEGKVRQNNLHLIRPFTIVHLEYFESFYEHRYQKELWNTIKMLWEVLRASGGISRPVRLYLRRTYRDLQGTQGETSDGSRKRRHRPPD